MGYTIYLQQRRQQAEGVSEQRQHGALRGQLAQFGQHVCAVHVLGVVGQHAGAARSTLGVAQIQIVVERRRVVRQPANESHAPVASLGCESSNPELRFRSGARVLDGMAALGYAQSSRRREGSLTPCRASAVVSLTSGSKARRSMRPGGGTRSTAACVLAAPPVEVRRKKR